MAAAALAQCTFWAVGCGPEHVRILHEPDAPIPIEGVVVGRVEIRLPNSASWHHYARTRDVLRQIEAIDGLDAFASWDYQVAQQPATPREYLTQTTLGPRTRALGVDPSRLAVLEVSVEDRTHAQHTALEGRDRSAEARGYGSEVLVRATLSWPARDTILATTERAITEDRFVDVPEYDERPQVTALVRETIAGLLEVAIDEELIVPAAPETPRTDGLLESAAPMLTHRAGDRPTLAERLATKDELLRESELYASFRYFHPDMDLPTVRRLGRSPGGLLLADGSLVVCLGPHRVRRTYEWRRIRRRHRDAPPVALPESGEVPCPSR